MRVEHVPHDRPDARLATADTRPARHTHRSQDARRPAAFLHRTENILISYQNYCRLSKTTHHCRLATHIHGNTTGSQLQLPDASPCLRLSSRY